MRTGTYIKHYYRYKTNYSYYRRCVLQFYTSLCHSRRNVSAILYPKQTCVVTAMQFYIIKKKSVTVSKFLKTAA
jgi:hypothetical protein